MTPRQIEIATALGRCSFPPATAAKRFARDMAFRARFAPEHVLTPRQVAYMLRLAHRYRRQLVARITELALDEAEDLAQRHPAAFERAPPPRRNPHAPASGLEPGGQLELGLWAA